MSQESAKDGACIGPKNDDWKSRLAAQLFPKEWSLVADKIGAKKKRQNLRSRAYQHFLMESLRREGCRCDGCNLFKSAPAKEGGPICLFHSDFHGVSHTKRDGLCVSWSPIIEREPRA